MLSEVKSVSGHTLEKLTLAFEGAEVTEVRGTNFLQRETTLGNREAPPGTPEKAEPGEFPGRRDGEQSHEGW